MTTLRQFEGRRLVVASHNRGKIEEIEALLADRKIVVQSAPALGLADVEETGSTFAANAELKARAALQCGAPALGDDSGLEVDALDGRPGVFSARYAGPNRDFAAAMRRLAREIDQLGPSASRKARFKAVLCLAWPDGEIAFAEGTCEGVIVGDPVGEGGFGYDPIFAPEGHSRTFGQMNQQEKAALSHRARALHRLIAERFA